MGGTASVWDAFSGRLLRTFHLAPEPVSAYFALGPLRAALNTDGSIVAVGDTYGRVFVWDVATGRLLAERLLEAEWPIVELEASVDGSRFLAVNYPQVGSGGANPPGDAEVLEASSGQVVASYQAVGQSNLTPINPGAALSPDGTFLLSGSLGLAPSPPGGYQDIYEIDNGQRLGGLEDVSEPVLEAYATVPAQSWSPDGTKVLVGLAVYACDACGDLHELQAAANSRLAWSQSLSSASDRPPTTSPFM